MKILLKNAILFVESNLTNKITIPFVAEKINASVSYISHTFSNYFNISLKQYIVLRRLISSSNDLVISDNKVIKIALKYNFNSHESYTRNFKKRFGISPSCYRKLIKVLDINKLYNLNIPDFKIYTDNDCEPYIDFLYYIHKNIYYSDKIEDRLNEYNLHFKKSFKKTFNIDILDYINLVKINYSSLELSQTDYPFEIISKLYGFKTLKEFEENFKKIYLLTPEKFREISKFLKTETTKRAI